MDTKGSQCISHQFCEFSTSKRSIGLRLAGWETQEKPENLRATFFSQVVVFDEQESAGPLEKVHSIRDSPDRPFLLARISVGLHRCVLLFAGDHDDHQFLRRVRTNFAVSRSKAAHYTVFGGIFKLEPAAGIDSRQGGEGVCIHVC